MGIVCLQKTLASSSLSIFIVANISPKYVVTLLHWANSNLQLYFNLASFAVSFAIAMLTFMSPVPNRMKSLFF